MKKLKTFIVIILLTSQVLGCGLVYKSTYPTVNEINAIKESAPPSNYKAAINQYLEKVLFDPFSAQSKIGEPRPGWFRNGPYTHSPCVTAYGVGVEVNARNRMGGYTGWKSYDFVFRGDQLVEVYGPGFTSFHPL